MNSSNDLVVLDIDNTLFDWVAYYVPAMEALIECVSHLTKICPDQIMKEAKAIFEAQGSIEYPFVIQELPCLHQRYYGRIEQLLTEIVLPGREAFRHAAKAKQQPSPHKPRSPQATPCPSPVPGGRPAPCAGPCRADLR